MQRAIQEGADYIGVGPVYETPTKVGKAAAGRLYPLRRPAFSLSPGLRSGVDVNNVNDVISAGSAWRWCEAHGSRATHSSNSVFQMTHSESPEL